MNNVVARFPSVRPLCKVATALLVVLAIAGCDRSPNGGAPSAASSPANTAKTVVNAPAPVPPTTAPTAAAPPITTTAIAATQPAESPRKFVAYYFHRTLRCPTCLSIEKKSKAAIEASYSGEIRAGLLAWQAVNIEDPGNEHFEKDFDLQTSSLVLVEMSGARVVRWTMLPNVWELVEDPDGFWEYVVTGVAEFLGG